MPSYGSLQAQPCAPPHTKGLDHQAFALDSSCRGSCSSKRLLVIVKTGTNEENINRRRDEKIIRHILMGTGTPVPLRAFQVNTKSHGSK